MDSVNLLQELDSISKIHTLKRGDIDGLMIEFAQRILTTLKIERMSVWLFNEPMDNITSMGEYELPTRKFTKGSTLLKKKYPTYFRSLSENQIILIENVYTNVITHELTEEYTLPNHIISLMDIPLRICGELVGVICYEKTGKKERIFNKNEQTFALSVALVLASTLEARQRRSLQDKLDQELREKILLIKEVHHRVKNNLTIVSGLINLQSNKVKDEYHKTLFDEHRSKIDSIAVIHELVYRSTNLTEINLKNYIAEITSNLQGVYSSESKAVEIIADIEEVIIELDLALPLGLIINEVITNSFKHAFTDSSSGKISITLKGSNGKFKLEIADNGKGLNLNEKREHSIGMDILEGLVEQIDAKHSYRNDLGTVFSMTFSSQK